MFRFSSSTLLIGGASLFCIILIGAGIFFSLKSPSTPEAQSSVVQDRLSHDTLSETNPTWSPNYVNLAEAISDLQLPPPGSILHHHLHLDLLINGQPVVLPAQIGLPGDVESPLHTHDTTGIIHIESGNVAFQPTLGQFFAVWGVYLGPTGIGGYTNQADRKLSVYLNGQPYLSDPSQLPLTHDHDEIFIAYGTPSQLPAPIPSSYQFVNL